MGEMSLMSAKGCLAVLDDPELVKRLERMNVAPRPGDTKIMWNPRDPEEVAAARATWDKLVKGKKFVGFAVKKSGKPGERVREFDPEAAKLIIAPPLAGGAVSAPHPQQEVRQGTDPSRYEFSVVELTGGTWLQGETLDTGESTADEFAETVRERLDDWISRCDTGNGEYKPALEINVTRVN